MCWSQQLFDAMIHVYNRGLTDYTTPLLELLLQLRATLKKGKPLPGVHLANTDSQMCVNGRQKIHKMNCVMFSMSKHSIMPHATIASAILCTDPYVLGHSVAYILGMPRAYVGSKVHSVEMI